MSNLRLLSCSMSKLNTCKERQVPTLKIIFLKELEFMDLRGLLLKTDHYFVKNLSFNFYLNWGLRDLQRWHLSDLFSWIKPVPLTLTLEPYPRFPPQGPTLGSHFRVTLLRVLGPTFPVCRFSIFQKQWSRGVL